MHSSRSENADTSSYTVMIVRGVGRIRKFKVSSRALFCLFLLIALYLVSSGIIIWKYIWERSVNIEYVKEIDSLRQEVWEMRRGIYRSKEHLKLLEDFIYNLDKRNTKKPDSHMAEIKKDETVKGENESKSVSDRRTQDPLVNIEELNFQARGNKILSTFKLINLQQGKGRVNGYVHMIGVFGNSDSPVLQAYPNTELKNGVPARYRSGLYFGIERFRTFRGEFSVTKENMPFMSLKVLVYGRDGNLIMERSYEHDQER